MLPSHCLPPLLLSWMPSWRCLSLLMPVWSPHLLKQTPMRPMTPPNWRTMRQPFLRILRWFPTLSRSFRMSSLRKLTSLLRWPVQWLRQPSLWLLKQTMRHFLPIFRRRWHWLRPARHLLTRHWQTTQPLFLSLPQLRRSVPLPSQKTGVRLGRFAAFAEFPAAVAEEAALLALEDAFVSDDFAASF